MTDPLLVEVKVASTDWANVSDKIRTSSEVTISRGRKSEDGASSPAECSLTFDNLDGRFSPRNPLSPLYGKIGKNTPLRVSYGRGKYGLVTTDSGNGCVFTVDSVGTSVTGDIDIRVDLEILPGSTRTWAASSFDVASKWTDFDTQRSWRMRVEGGQIRFTWWALGTLASERSLISSTTIPAPATGRRAARVTLDVDNGAAGCTATFYTAPTIAGPWTQLGTPVTSAGTTVIFDGTAGTRIGGTASAAATPAATFYAAEYRNGINGTVVASPDFTVQPLDPVPFGFSAFTDAQGNSWTPQGSADAARIWYGDVDVRHVGEIASLPPRWDESEKNRWVPITANGVLRRYGQGTDPAPSGLRDFILSQFGALTSYFPLAGSEGTQYSVNLGRVGTNSYRFFKEGGPLIKYGVDMGAEWLGTGLEITGTGNSFLRADVAAGDDNFTLDFVFQSKAMGVLQVRVFDYRGNWFNLKLQDASNNGTVQVTYFDGQTGTGIWTGTLSSPVPALVNNNAFHTCRFKVENTLLPAQRYSVYFDGNDTPLLQETLGPTPRSWDSTAVYRLLYGQDNAAQDVVNLAHLALWSIPLGGPAIPLFSVFDQAARGYAGETAHARMTRVAALNGIPLVIKGAAGDTAVMGPQHAESALTQILDAASTDMGILTETRDQLALLYRTRRSLYNQTPVMTINYAARELFPPFEPVDDDQQIRNDVTASRRDGDSVRVTRDTGPLSVQDPPAGVGRYKDSVTVNVQGDDQLPLVAAWLLNQGTLDQPRYPSVSVNLKAPEVVANAVLTAAVPLVDVGDLIRITGMQSVGIFDDIDLIVLGCTEVLGPVEQVFTWNCAPATGYTFAKWGAGAGTGPDRWDTTYSALTSSITTFGISFTVTSPAGALWTTNVAEFPLDINIEGEQMRLTSIVGSSSPQTFNVSSRSVNGVVKAHPAGAAVTLAKTPRYGY